jgi:hypothetical protein
MAIVLFAEAPGWSREGQSRGPSMSKTIPAWEGRAAWSLAFIREQGCGRNIALARITRGTAIPPG